MDTEGSGLVGSEDKNENQILFEVEGIGYDFIPTVLDRSVSMLVHVSARKCWLVLGFVF